jgi:hypothetical protein
MNTNFYFAMAVLNSFGDERKLQERPSVSEPVFEPFDLSYLRDFPRQSR